MKVLNGLASVFGIALGISSFAQIVNQTQTPFWPAISTGALVALLIVWGLVNVWQSTSVLKKERVNFTQELAIAWHDSGNAVKNCVGNIGKWLHRVSHDIRDQSEKLLLVSRSQEPISERVKDMTTTTGEKVCNSLEELFTVLCDEPVAVSLKLIDDEGGVEEAVTLCRSHRSNGERLIGDRHPLTFDNTAFFEIRSGTVRYYGKSDLVTEQDKGQYNNTNPRWQGFYESAIVVPIRAENLDPATRQAEKFILRGFLCIDAKSTLAFPDEMIVHYVETMMAAGDSLYRYLDIAKSVESHEDMEKTSGQME